MTPQSEIRIRIRGQDYTLAELRRCETYEGCKTIIECVCTALEAERAKVVELEKSMAVLRGGDDHPEDRCQACGCRNVTWFAANPLWNRVMAEDERDIICPVCFVQRAEECGVDCTGWELVPENLMP